MFNKKNKSAGFTSLDIQQSILVIVMGNTYAFSIQSDHLNHYYWWSIIILIYYIWIIFVYRPTHGLQSKMTTNSSVFNHCCLLFPEFEVTLMCVNMNPEWLKVIGLQFEIMEIPAGTHFMLKLGTES